MKIVVMMNERMTRDTRANAQDFDEYLPKERQD
jgi:hypothetical protein